MHLVFDQLPLTQNKLYYQLFSTGHSASSAHHAYETKLVLESDEHIMTSLADRAINPNAQDVSRLYIKWREEHLGPENGNARKIVQQYNSQHKDDGGQIVINRYCSECSDPEVELNSDQETPHKKRKLACKKRKEASLRVAICTPLMARVDKSVHQSKEIAFLDSTSSLDRYNLSMFLLSTCHAVRWITTRCHDCF